MLSQYEMDALKQVAKGIAGHFGSSCEVVIHELSERSADSSIVAIENGHVSGRKAGRRTSCSSSSVRRTRTPRIRSAI